MTDIKDETTSEPEKKDWTLDSLEEVPYLPDRKPFVSDYIFKTGALVALVLALMAMFSNRF